jgi:serpin B
MTEDQKSLQDYLQHGRREALDRLIRRHLDLVYSSALRQVRDPHAAEDVTQAVFLILAQKAGTIRAGVAVGGWLLAVTRRAAIDAIRRRAIDRRHEQTMAKPEIIPMEQPRWEQMAPVLDSALSRLSEADRDAIVLRFFQDRSLAQVGAEMGISEDAAQKRVGRALDRLRNLMSGKSIAIGAAALGAAITANAVQAAPAHLLPATLAGTASSSITAIVKGAINMMAWARAKFVASVVTTIVVLAGGGTFLITRALAQPQLAAPPPVANRGQVAQAPVDPIAARTALVSANNRFALDLLRQFNPAPTENAFFSPYSISTAVAMTHAGAAGETAAQIAKAFHFSELPDNGVTVGFNALQKSLAETQSKTGAQLTIANSLWPELRPESPFRAKYMNQVQQDFGAEIRPMDFKRNFEDARQQINHWVEGKTQNRIKDPLHSGDLDDATRLVLVNAIYFKAEWGTKFQAFSNIDAQFRLSDGGSVPVVLMRNTLETPYAEVTLDSQPVQILALNYKNNASVRGGGIDDPGLCFIAILPKDPSGLAMVNKSLTAETLATWMGKLSSTRTQILLPKFTFQQRYSLTDTMRQMGIVSAFIDPLQDPSNGADFSGMNGVRNLFISKAIHQTFVNVDEDGTEAAAATAIVMGAGGAPRAPEAVFRADHPFLFLIRDNVSGSILFLGQLTNPPKPEQTAAAGRAAIQAQRPGRVTSPLPGSISFAQRAGDTTTSRLVAAQASLNKAKDYLTQTPDELHDGQVAKALTSVNQALAGITRAMDYVKEHPEIDPLPTGSNTGGPPTTAVAIPALGFTLPANFGPNSTMIAGSRGAPTTTLGPPDKNGLMAGVDGRIISVNLLMAANYLNTAHTLLSNPGGRGTYTGRLIGDIGGYNEPIKAEIKKAAEAAVAGLNFVRDHADPASAKTAERGR